LVLSSSCEIIAAFKFLPVSSRSWPPSRAFPAMQSSLSIRTISLIISGESPSRHRTPNNRVSPPRYFSQLNPSGNHSSSACETELLREKCVHVLSQKSPSRLPHFRECPGWKGHGPSPPFEADSASGIGRQARGDPSTEPQIAARLKAYPIRQKQQVDLRTLTSNHPPPRFKRVRENSISLPRSRSVGLYKKVNHSTWPPDLVLTHAL
jgi:hypothetical protein